MARTHGLGAGHCGARLAAVQSGLMRAAVEEWFRRVLSFHSRVGEAEAMAVSVPAVAARLAEDDPDTLPARGPGRHQTP